MKRKVLSFALTLCLGLSAFAPSYVFADSNLLYTDKETQTITDGLTFEKSERLYKSGWKDVYVLVADLTNPNINVEILSSATEYGLKKNVQSLVSENGAVAGVNADFFGSGNPGSSMGQIIVDGNVREAQNYYNASSNKYAGIFFDKYGNAFVDYIKSNLRLYNNSVNLDVQAKNKITDFKKPVIFNNLAITNTSDLDKRNKNLFKVVVENNVITKKAGAGEVVNVPENGYIIVMDKATASEKLALFNIGDSITFSESYKFVFRDGKDIKDVVEGISAGGEILRNGKPISTGMAISPKSRNPRTAVGTNKEKNKLILVAVDGRGQSIGATHDEMANILLEYGAYDAIHLDGGGSTTVALREEGQKNINIVNNVSDKSPRLVPNAIGIKSNNPTKEPKTLLLNVENNKDKLVIASDTYKLNVSCVDENKNPVDIDKAKLSFSCDNPNVVINGEHFICNTAGEYTIKASYDNMAYGEITIKALEPYSFIAPRTEKPSIAIGDNTPIYIDAKNKDGYSKAIDSSQISFSVDNPDIGYMQNNIFYGKKEGIAKITATYNNISATISIAVGNTKTSLSSFEENRNLFMMYFPADKTVSGGAGITNATSSDGQNSLLLSYKFKANSPSSQASYVCFEKQPLIFSGKPTSIQMDVKGDNSHNMLKAVIKDNNNKEYILPVIADINSTEWSVASFNVPSGVAYPIRLDKLYVGTNATTNEESGTIYIDNINGMVQRNDGGTVENGYNDYLKADLSSIPLQEGEEDINVFGQTASLPYQNSKQILQDAVNKMSQNARALVFAGSTNLEGINTNVTTVSWNNKYNTTNTNNLSIISLATKSGVMRTESPDQWRWLQSYLENQSKNNILITMDKDIWSKENGLKGSRENELLHKILKEFVEKTGKNVIVVSAVSNNTSVNVKDGIRYITLNGLSSSSNDKTSYKFLKIRANQNDLKYDIINVY